MATGKINIDYASAVQVTLSAATATVALPANAQLVGVSVNVNARFRVCGPQNTTAVVTDPLITPNSEIQIIRPNGGDTNVSAILDPSVTPAANQVLSLYRVYEA